jgi:transcriptional regulator with XRE-family HTH domain
MALEEDAPSVGALLREWRERRSLTQREVASRSAVSARHLSFVETGRARPSREMVLHLAERFDVPLRERNRLLLAAGYAPVFGERSLDDREMAPVREALERFLAAHEPYPALVVDRGCNLAAWGGYLLARLRRDIEVTRDPDLESLYEELVAYPELSTVLGNAEEPDLNEIMLMHELSLDDAELSLFCTFTTFGTARDLTLAELTIAAFYPADAQTAEVLAAAVGDPEPG